MRALVVLALLAAACGASGHPRHAGSSSRPVSPASVAPLSQPRSSVTPTPAVGGCAPHAVTATDAPFCYPLPRRFTDFSARDDYAYGWQWRTLVALDAHDLIEVIGQPVQADLDRLTDAAAVAYAHQLALQVGALGVVQTGPVVPATIDGARAYAQFAVYAHGVRAQNYVVMHGHDVIDLSCQSTSRRSAVVTAACGDVLATIVIG